jgi:hypothetical protein
MERPVLDTHQKARSINLDKRKYGTLAEIGAGQETARWFFRVGGAAGTIAKAISAYDMQVSDSLYGPCRRYVSRERLQAMLDFEYDRLQSYLGDSRGDESTFFVFANTVATFSFTTGRPGHGWLGIRFQATPHAAISQIDLHVVLKGSDNLQDQEILGQLGVNLVYGALYLHDDPDVLLASLLDGLGTDQLEIDMVDFQGAAFTDVDNRLMALRLVQHGLSSAAMFRADGRVVQPADALYGKAVLVERSRFRPPTRLNMDLLDCATREFYKEPEVSADNTLVLSEMTLHNLGEGEEIDAADFLGRVEILCALGKNVIITDYGEFYRLAQYLFSLTQKPVGVALGVTTLREIFNEEYYQHLDGGILESFGRMFKHRLRLYVCPACQDGTDDLLTVHNLEVQPNLRHLYLHLQDNGCIRELTDIKPEHLMIHSHAVLESIRNGQPGWEAMVPDTVAALIREKQLFRCA